MMIDANIAAARPVTLHRMLAQAGSFDRWNRQETGKRIGVYPPKTLYEHRHVDDITSEHNGRRKSLPRLLTIMFPIICVEASNRPLEMSAAQGLATSADNYRVIILGHCGLAAILLASVVAIREHCLS